MAPRAMFSIASLSGCANTYTLLCFQYLYPIGQEKEKAFYIPPGSNRVPGFDLMPPVEVIKILFNDLMAA